MVKAEKLFTVLGIDIYSDSIYIVSAKEDKTNPYTELRKYGRKFPGVPDSREIPFKTLNGEDGTYDLCTDIDSFIWDGVDAVTAKENIAKIKKHLIEPLKKYIGDFEKNPDILTKNCSVSVTVGQQFVTKDIKQLFELYKAIISRAVCAEEYSGNPRFGETSFIVKNSTVVSKIEERETERRMEATSIFVSLFKENLIKLNQILAYECDLEMQRSLTLGQAGRMFEAYLSRSEDNAESFIKTYNLSDDSIFATTLELTSKVKKAIRAGKIKYEPRVQVYYIGSQSVGKSVKEVVELLKLKESKDLLKVLK